LGSVQIQSCRFGHATGDPLPGGLPTLLVGGSAVSMVTMPPDGVVGIGGGMPVVLRDGVGGAGSLAAGGFGKVVLLGKVDLAGKIVDVDGECLATVALDQCSAGIRTMPPVETLRDDHVAEKPSTPARVSMIDRNDAGPGFYMLAMQLDLLPHLQQQTTSSLSGLTRTIPPISTRSIRCKPPSRCSRTTLAVSTSPSGTRSARRPSATS
jgi:hypothetical protein